MRSQKASMEECFELSQSGQKLLQSGAGFGYYKVEQLVLQSGTDCIVTKWDNFIIKWDGYYKVGQFYYKVGRVLQNGPIFTKWSSTN